MKLSYTGLVSAIYLSCLVVLFGSFSTFLLPQIAMAGGFSFDQIAASNQIAPSASKAKTTNLPAQTSAIEVAMTKDSTVIHLQNPEDMKKLAQALQLNDEQRDGIVSLINNQVTLIEENVHSLNLAHSMLVNMATNKHYDEFIANSAADQIAKSSATLGILQAEREFKIYSILTVDQAKKFDVLQTNNIIQLL